MPPKPCSARSTTALQDYINQLDKKQETKLRSQFAKALQSIGYLGKFDKNIFGANECMFSYPPPFDKWYSIYLKDDDGNQYWDYSGTKATKLYFEIDVSDTDPKITNMSITAPADMKDDRNCMMSSNGKCVGPPKEAKEPKIKEPTIKAVKESKPVKSSSEDKASADILRVIEPMNVGTASSTRKKQEPRQFFENMEDKTLIVSWMLKNMNLDDIHTCIKRGGLSQEDIQRANAIRSESSQSSGGVDNLVESVKQMSISDVKEASQLVSAEELRKKITGEPAERRKKLVSICKKNNIDPTGMTLSKMLGKCIAAEAIRIRNVIKENLMTYTRRKQALAQPQGRVEPKAEPRARVSKDEILANTPGDFVSVEYFKEIVKYFPQIKGLTINGDKLNGAFPVPGKKTFYKAIDIKYKNLISLESEIQSGKILAFGKRKINSYQQKFKMAAKSCKGTANYRACMKKTLTK